MGQENKRPEGIWVLSQLWSKDGRRGRGKIMKAVLISIRPKWVEKITRGEKTLEVRKTRPKLETPFKCYIYCTRVKRSPLGEYVEVHRKTGGAVDEWQEKVMGEFICDTILPVRVECNSPADLGAGIEVPGTCLTDREIIDYLGSGKQGYLWHISGLKLYGEPKELAQFDGLRETGFGFELRQLEHPPQSWCYVEG